MPVAAFEVYDFQTSRWRRLPDIPSKRVFALYAHSDSHIFSVGGLHQDAQPTFTDVTEVFDLDTGEFFDCIIIILLFNWLEFCNLKSDWCSSDMHVMLSGRFMPYLQLQQFVIIN